MNGGIKTELTPAEMKSLAYLFVHEMQNNTHCAMDWKSREKMEAIVSNVIFSVYDVDKDVSGWTKGMCALVLTAEIREYPDHIQHVIERIQKRVWTHLVETRKKYYEL